MVLWVGCFETWLRFLTHDRVDLRQWTDCKLHLFLFRFGRHYSSMLLVLMSFEKYFAVYFPLKSKTVCTVKTAKWSTGVLGILMAGFNLVYIVVLKSFIIKASGHHICVYIHKRWKILGVLDKILYSFLPLVLMFITNFAIVYKFMTAKCKSNSAESTNQALAKAATRGTIMVVTVSITFLILTAPTAVNSALWNVIQLSQIPMYRVFMNLTQYLNHSINGVLYIIVGMRFRTELLRLFRRKKLSDSTSLSHSVNSTSLVTISRSRT